MKTMTQQEFLAEAKRRFGEDPKKWKFVCPACGTIQSVQQLLDALINVGFKKDDVHGYIGYSCIGRFTKAGDVGISAKHLKRPWNKGCNWTLGGLLQIHTLEIVMEDNGNRRPCFEFADPANPTPEYEYEP